MSTKPKSHKALTDGEWKGRLTTFASTGIWPSNAGNRPSRRQQKWLDLYQKIEKCPMQARGQTTLFGESVSCNCGFHTAEPPPAALQSVASDLAPSATDAAPTSFLSPPPNSATEEHGAGVVQPDAAGAEEASFWLPGEMSKSIPVQDQRWIANTLFHSRRLRPDLRLWYEPPDPALNYNQAPEPDHFFTHQLMVWMPYHMWKVKVSCPVCGEQLTENGVHERAFKVLDIDRYYLMVTESLRCSVCSLSYLSTSHTVRNQLNLLDQKMFHLILTRNYAFDIQVVRLLRDEDLRNRPAQLVRLLKVHHGKQWMTQAVRYLRVCADFVSRPSFIPMVCQDPPDPTDVPTSCCLKSVYGRDILSRIDHIKASITSTFGSILKLGSTKNITNKLAGYDKGTALWLTSVSNEMGHVLTTVLTIQDGPGLDRMATGLIERYRQAAVPPPVLLYVESGCCMNDGSSKMQTMFGEWPDLHIRLDIWHFMQRLAVGCTTASHPFYSTFISSLCTCIFEWDAGDLALLRQAKKRQLIQKGVQGLTDLALDKRISEKELRTYCRRRTRGEMSTIRLIEELLQKLGAMNWTDRMVPLLDEVRMAHIWRKEKCHVKCIQDVPGVQLYAEMGTTDKGGITLKKYRCTRECMSLESFHCHLNKFIPGASANTLNFQLYLLEGLNSWNHNRGPAAVTGKPSSLLTYAGDMLHIVHTLSLKLFGRAFISGYKPPNKYTGELLGVDYLLNQTGQRLEMDPDSVETEDMLEDINISEEEEFYFDEDPTIFTLSTLLDEPIYTVNSWLCPSTEPLPTSIPDTFSMAAAATSIPATSMPADTSSSSMPPATAISSTAATTISMPLPNASSSLDASSLVGSGPGPAHHNQLPTSTKTQLKRKAPATTLTRASPAYAMPVAVNPCPQRQLIFVLPPGSQLVMLTPVTSQVPVHVAAQQAMGISSSSAPPAPAPVRKLTRKVLHKTCHKCGQFRTRETGHNQYKGIVYCPSVETVSKEEWLEDMKKKKRALLTASRMDTS